MVTWKWFLSLFTEVADIRFNEPEQLDLWEKDQQCINERRRAMWQALGLDGR